MRLPAVLVIACAFAGLALTQARAELKTTETAIACSKLENLQAAEEAQGDRAKLDMLGCFPVMAGIPAKRMDDGEAGPIWHVILDPDGSDPMEVWARPSSFSE